MRKRSAYRKKSVHPLLIQMEQKALREKWDAESVTAGIHALIGADKTQLISHSGLLFFVASGCAIYLGWMGDEPDFRIVSASINAIDDLKAKKEIEDVDRASLMSGMNAASRIIAQTPIYAVHENAMMYRQWMDSLEKSGGII
jgi:hypothetical protein